MIEAHMCSSTINPQKTVINSSHITKTTVARLMVFDLSIYGHHPSYIQHLISNWYEEKRTEKLDIVVSPQFLQVHADVVDIALASNGAISFVAITPEEELSLKPRSSGLNRAIRKFQEWKLLCKYAKLLNAEHCLLMYFDTCKLPLSWGQKAPCPFSGIYFRPTFHYNSFVSYSGSWKDRIQQWREKVTLSRILHHPQLKVLFCLDSFAVKHIGDRNSVKVVHLPDPVQLNQVLSSDVERLRHELNIDPSRQVFLLFGALESRKGIDQLLEAIPLMETSLCKRLCILLVGESAPAYQSEIENKIANLCAAYPIQIIRHYKFITEREVSVYFQLADAILAPYQKHVGMSGILLLAAAAQKPVLSSNFGLMGEMVVQHSLGLTVDSTIPDTIAQGLSTFLTEKPEHLCDRSKMLSLTEQSSTKKFAETIFQNIKS